MEINEANLSIVVTKLTKKYYYQFISREILFFYLLFVLITTQAGIQRSENNQVVAFVGATSINYGIYQTPITDVTLLMPKLCQNQSTICEGSFCIPGIRRCVCDLRMPVQFDRYCLKQVDIDTKCFVTSQCNHTVKDAVCIDINSNAILDIESSRFKLDQWQQLNELRQLSQSSFSSSKQQQQLEPTTPKSISSPAFTFYDEPFGTNNLVELRDDVINLDVRNSPYEINYNTPELLHQNHTRRRHDHTADRNHLQALASHTGNRIIHSELPITLPSQSIETTTITTTPVTTSSQSDLNQQQPYITSTLSPIVSTSDQVDTNTFLSTNTDLIDRTTTTTTSNSDGQSQTSIPETSTTITVITSPATEPTSNVISNPTTPTPGPTTTTTHSNRKLITKNQSWPPGICSCPFGHIFSSKLRKCMLPSLVDSHCTVDYDCKQIPFTHCSRETRKCICDEPLVWNQSSCVRPSQQQQQQQDIYSSNQYGNPKKHKSMDNQLELGTTNQDTSSLLSTTTFSLLDNVSLSIILILIFFIIAILIIVEFVKCFSGSNNSTLISPRRQNNEQKSKVKQSQQPTTNVDINGMVQTNASSTSNPKSPYATLRRQENGPNSQLSNFSQATRGRILNYDFEQENNGGGVGSSKMDTIGSQAQSQSNSTATNALKITFLFIV